MIAFNLLVTCQIHQQNQPGFPVLGTDLETHVTFELVTCRYIPLLRNNKFYDRHIDLLTSSQSLEGITIFSEEWDRFFEVIRKTWRCLHSLHTDVRPCLRTTNYMIPVSTTCDHLNHCKILEGAGIYKFLTALFKSLACTVVCEDKIFNEINPLSKVKIKYTTKNSFRGSKPTRIRHSHHRYMNRGHHLGPSLQYLHYHYHRQY